MALLSAHHAAHTLTCPPKTFFACLSHQMEDAACPRFGVVLDTKADADLIRAPQEKAEELSQCQRRKGKVVF
jgi:hypothetical protein